MFNQYKKTIAEFTDEVEEKDFLVRSFFSKRNYIRSEIGSFSNIKGNSKYVSDALTLFWTELATLFNSGINKEYTNEISDFLLMLLRFSDYETKEERSEFQKIYLFLINQNNVRGFNLNEDITSIIKEEWFRKPIIKASDYLLFPDCIESYESYVPDVDEDDCTQWRLFDDLAELVHGMDEYFDLIRVLILNKKM